MKNGILGMEIHKLRMKKQVKQPLLYYLLLFSLTIKILELIIPKMLCTKEIQEHRTRILTIKLLNNLLKKLKLIFVGRIELLRYLPNKVQKLLLLLRIITIYQTNFLCE
jgi:hypothetical protein